MEFGIIGISYLQADIALRETAMLTDSKKLDMYNALLAHGITQAVLVSTCNRSELYIIYESHEQVVFAKELYLQYSSSRLSDIVFVKEKQEAMTYLFEVCAGVHSIALGEDQIAHQIQEAYAFSNACGMCGKAMHRIMQSCFHSVKEGKKQFLYNQFPTSIPYLAMQYIKTNMEVQDARVMIIGSGDMARLLFTYLKDEPVESITLCARRQDMIMDLLEDRRTSFVPFEKRYEVVNLNDIIISVTASPHSILQKQYYPTIHHLQLLMDLASPRDIEESIGDGHLQMVCNLDMLQKQLDVHFQKRKEQIEEALPFLHKRAKETSLLLHQEGVERAMQSMQQKSEQIAQDTYDLLNRKLQLSHHEQRLMKKILQTSFLRMVREPMQRLKGLEIEEQQQVGELLREVYEGKETS